MKGTAKTQPTFLLPKLHLRSDLLRRAGRKIARTLAGTLLFFSSHLHAGKGLRRKSSITMPFQRREENRIKELLLQEQNRVQELLLQLRKANETRRQLAERPAELTTTAPAATAFMPSQSQEEDDAQRKKLAERLTELTTTALTPTALRIRWKNRNLHRLLCAQLYPCRYTLTPHKRHEQYLTKLQEWGLLNQDNRVPDEIEKVVREQISPPSASEQNIHLTKRMLATAGAEDFR